MNGESQRRREKSAPRQRKAAPRRAALPKGLTKNTSLLTRRGKRKEVQSLPFDSLFRYLSFLLLSLSASNTGKIFNARASSPEGSRPSGRELFLLVCIVWSLAGNQEAENKHRMVDAFFRFFCTKQKKQ